MDARQYILNLYASPQVLDMPTRTQLNLMPMIDAQTLAVSGTLNLPSPTVAPRNMGRNLKKAALPRKPGKQGGCGNG